MLEFRDITLEDKPQVDACARAYSYHLCEHCFTDLFIWRGHYKTRICFWEGFLFVRMQTLTDQSVMYLAPIGEGDLAAAIGILEQDARDNGVPFAMCSIAEEMKNRIEQVMPDRFEYSTDESGWDYIYLSEKLQTLSGKKLQSKRNLVNRFQAAYEGRWSYEDISEANTHDAFQFHIKWCEQNGCMRDQEFWGRPAPLVRRSITLTHWICAVESCGWMAKRSPLLWDVRQPMTCLSCRLKKPTTRSLVPIR